MNNNVAIWSREKEDISDEEYQKFYKAISKETLDAQSWIHFKAEGEVIYPIACSVHSTDEGFTPSIVQVASLLRPDYVTDNVLYYF